MPFQTNQEWYATFTGEDGSRYAVTLEDEDTLALKFYLDGEEDVYKRQEPEDRPQADRASP